ncbi:MAG: tRNA (N6-isopentenyl adenosine(37)-C2)-methylthiotransferase MiaB [Clostridia bacterium]|nr:tRNA (N6-isopentenyl adenosine(37)-C2)-methylthiotransferase MiaB [Clostridia bacterium]
MMRSKNILPPEEVEAQAAYLSRVRERNLLYASQTGRRKKAYVLTFGCQQNEADSEKLAGMAESMEYEIVSSPDDADLIAVNTCAIREHAEKKALSIVGQFKHLKAKKPDMMIAVCGCMVTQAHRCEEIKHRYPYVDFVFGTSSIHRFPQLLCEKQEKGKRLYCPEEKEYLVAEGLPIHRESSYRAWVSIMYGCNNFCSYCIVPYVRGRERSREMSAIVSEVRELVERGYKDITLLGQNVNSYGKDAGYSYDFADLLEELDRIEGDYVLRFMTSHPKDAGKKLIDVMAASKHVARQFHLPMQSGSDAILQRMNRKYDTKQYLETVAYMREKMPDITITSDIIVGFPGETEEDFEGTLQMLRHVRFDMLYSFIYSPRKGTPAAEMEDQVPPQVQHERFERLLALQKEIGAEKNQNLIGKTLRVLCDGVSKGNDRLYSGRTDGNKIAFFEGEPEDTGRFVTFCAERADAFSLYGKKN